MVISITSEGRTDLNKLPTVTIYRSNNQVEKGVTKGKTILKYGDIIEVPSNTIIELYTGDIENECILEGHLEIEIKKSTFRPIKGILGRLIMKIKKGWGKLTVSDPKNNRTMGTVKTEFAVEVNGDTTNFRLLEGKVAITNRTKVRLKNDELLKIGALTGDSISGESNLNRQLYITEFTQFLDINNNIDSVSTSKERILDTDEKIDTFFKEQLKVHQQKLRKSGIYSRKGLKKLNQGLLEEGKIHFEKAVAEEEISIDQIIESALILTEGYFLSNKLNQRKVWLDAALHFTGVADSVSRQKQAFFKSLQKEHTADIFLGDEVLVNEYYAWAYTVKLIINGCLENPSENPRRFLRKALQLQQRLDKKSN